MAITATTALGSATVNAEQGTTATVTVSNSGGAAVNVTQFIPTCVPSGATVQSVSVSLGNAPIGPGMTVSVAASGTLALSFGVVAHAPPNESNPAMPTQYVYTVGATIYTSDGSVTTATGTSLTVNHYP